MLRNRSCNTVSLVILLHLWLEKKQRLCDHEQFIYLHFNKYIQFTHLSIFRYIYLFQQVYYIDLFQLYIDLFQQLYY